jgi:rhamnulokinase
MPGSADTYLACDLGAESGRVVAGCIAGDRLELEELHRFTNGPVETAGTLRWDPDRIRQEIVTGLAIAGERFGDRLAGVGVDTWGVDFGLLDAQGRLIEQPWHYRDARTTGMMEEAFSILERGDIFARTGIQFMQLNTLFQLLAMVCADSEALDRAERLLFMPDLFAWMLSGSKVNEFTISTTSQCFDPRAGTWAHTMLEELEIPTRIFGRIVPPGTILGELLPEMAEATGCRDLPVIAPGSHDTASAVAAVPSSAADAIYLSSGTWSLMGVEVAEPVITEQSLEHNLTNEGGVGDRFRLLKNIMGLWLVQECRREWAAQGRERSYEELTALATGAPAFGPLVDPGDERFLQPGNMPERMRAACRETGQPEPEDEGALVRCALESLACEYRRVAGILDELTGRKGGVIHIIGGGSQNRLLNQLTADATGRRVLAGPVEATAMGNIMVQAMARGEIASLAEGRALITASVEPEEYLPRADGAWDGAFERYLTIRENSQRGTGA